MELNITKVLSGSILFLMIAACRQKPVHSNESEHKQSIKKITCYLEESAGQDVIRPFGCMNCHLRGEDHLNDSSYLSDYGRIQTKNFSELASLDSLKIIEYLIQKKHKNLYGNHLRLDRLTDCDIRNLIYYLHQSKLSKIYP